MTMATWPTRLWRLTAEVSSRGISRPRTPPVTRTPGTATRVAKPPDSQVGGSRPTSALADISRTTPTSTQIPLAAAPAAVTTVAAALTTQVLLAATPAAQVTVTAA